ncbi:MAG: saccharopine dehydrogenase C-terminal domain-containing protein [Ferruginibacter sp.]
MKITVLGAGMVGRAIATDLAKQYDVTVYDISNENLGLIDTSVIIKIQSDLTQYEHYQDMLADADIVVCAVPGFMGYETLQQIIRCKKNVVDISFFPEDALALNNLARENNVTAIVDCGVAPGMSNLILGYYDGKMKIDNFLCMVGGLPKERIKPFEYKAPFSPIDVIEEYTRPARYVQNGHIITRPALSDAVLIDFHKAGTLESFNTDGLRSIMFTMPHIPNMKEKTLRYPGHIDLMKALIKAGFLSTTPLLCRGNEVKPIDFTAALLFEQWKLQPGEKEFTIMQIILEGTMKEKKTRIEYFLYDEYDTKTNVSSMSRTTGYTCTAAVNLVANNLFNEKGIFPPELVARQPGCFEFILNYLAERNVQYKKIVREY